MFDLPETVREVQRLANDFARKDVASSIDGFVQSSTFPAPLVRTAAQLGLFGIPYPEAYGGSAAGTLANAVMLEEIARVDPSLAVILMTNNSPSAVLNAFGTPQQKERWLTPLASGQMLGSVAMTEGIGGSDVAGIKTRAVREGDAWVINGQKAFITNSNNEMTGLVIVLAVTGERDGKPVHSLIAVPRHTPGYSVSAKIHTIGWKACESCELFFDRVRVPADHLIGDEGKGLRQVLTSLGSGRIHIAAICLGLAQGAFDRAAAYARERIAFGKPIGDYQGVSFKLADMATRVQAGRWLVYHAAELADQGKDFRTEASMAKLFCSEVAFDAAREAIQIHGAWGLGVDASVSKLLGDAKILEIVEGTSEIQRVILGRLLDL